MAWETIWTIIVLKGSIHKKILSNTVKNNFLTRSTTVQNGQYGQKLFKPVKIGPNGQWRSKAVNTVKNSQKWLKNKKKMREKNLKQSKRLTIVKTGHYGPNCFFYFFYQNSQHPLSSVSLLLYFSCRHVCSCLFVRYECVRVAWRPWLAWKARPW